MRSFPRGPHIVYRKVTFGKLAKQFTINDNLIQSEVSETFVTAEWAVGQIFKLMSE